MLVSVIIPTYSRPNNLCRAIDSVLCQTCNKFEIIVVDDNGIGTKYQKQTEQLLFNYIKNKQIIYIKHEKNLNGSAARYTGLKYIFGLYISFLDDDDTYWPTFLSESIKVLSETSEDVGASYCNSIWILKNHQKINKINHHEGVILSSILLRQCTCSTSTILLKKSACDKLGGFDTRFRRHQDWEFLVRFFRYYKIKLVNHILVTKYSTETPGSNMVDALKMYQIKRFFFETYKNDIDALPEHNKIYSLHWKEVAFLLARQGYWNQAYKTLILANRYSNLCFRDYGVFVKKLILSIVYKKK